jgi:hypothetical protein
MSKQKIERELDRILEQPLTLGTERKALNLLQELGVTPSEMREAMASVRSR